MKFHRLTPIFPKQRLPSAILAVALSLGLGTIVQAAPITLADLPLTLTGTTGGNQTSESCGSIPDFAPLELNLDRASYLQVTVQTSADTTLWIDGPLDFCVLWDPTANQLHTAGHWPEGLYQIYVGDRQGQSHAFSLTVSQ